MIDVDELRERLVGMELAPGRYVVRPYQAWLHADALGSPALPEGLLHPMYVFNAALSGLGITVEEQFALGGIAMDEGPMGADMDLRQLRPMRVDEEVTVTGRIVGLERKHGRQGTFDLMHVEITVRAADDDVIGVVVNGYIFPRRG